MPTLRFHRDGQLVLTHRLRPGRTVIGRDDDVCDIAVPDETLSRRHCVVEWDGALAVQVVDLSSGGTYLEGQRIAVGDRPFLRDGAAVTLGEHKLTLALRDGQSPASRTRTRDVPRTPAGEVVRATPGGVITVRHEIRFLAGPLSGQRVVVTDAVVELGGQRGTVPLPTSPRGPAEAILELGERVRVRPGVSEVRVGRSRVTDVGELAPGRALRVGVHRMTVARVEDELPLPRGLDEIGGSYGTTPAMHRLHGMIAVVAPQRCNVLVTGESGTGKGVVAKTLHDVSQRVGEYVELNVTGVAEGLFEAALFGHERGAFTGAVERKRGAFERAHEGTLLLDEIGDLPLALQVKLLHAVETGRFTRVGGEQVLHSTARIIAATHRDLLQMVRAGTFRLDLYYRLHVVNLHVPPLRERTDDLPVLAERALARDFPTARLTPAAVRRLQQHRWPGNVRELGNVLTRAAALAGGEAIDARHLSFQDLEAPARVGPATPLDRETFERLYAEHGSLDGVADAVKMAKTTLWRRLRDLGIEVVRGGKRVGR